MQFTPQQITIFFLVSWFVIFIAGKLQQNRIRKKLIQRIKQGINKAKEEIPELTLDSYYTWVFSNWESLVKQNALFVLSKSELLPASANPGRLKKNWNLTPIWLGAFMKKNHLSIKMTDKQQKEVDAILNAYPDKQR
jgi:hypothetical protein